jgi:NhaP-type Na+/H+ or K+/H+ antiporter
MRLITRAAQMGTDDLLACFAAGLAFSWDDRQRRLHEDESVHDILDTLVNAAVFIYMCADLSGR